MPDLDPTNLVTAYGYWAIALIVGLESMGVPLPGETTLVAAAVYAGTTHRLGIGWVILAAAFGAILGDNAGFWIGRELGFRLLVRYGRHIGLSEGRLKLGQYLFRRHGGKVVFLARFVAVLRVLAALLAGVNCMPWPRFLLFNAAGGVVWALAYGLVGYGFGEAVHQIAGPISVAGLALAVVAVAAGFLFLRRHETQLQAKAARALPGPLDPRSGEACGDEAG